MSSTQRKKSDAVLRVLRGEHAEQVATDLGVSSSDITSWEKRFMRAGKRALSIDFDGDWVPTLDGLISMAQRGFPQHVLADVDSCAGLFAARFYGKNDVIHVLLAGLPDVHVVDIDAPRIKAMQSIYPKRWTYIVADVFELVQTYISENKRFDVVICDCYQGMAKSVILERFSEFEAITNHNLLVYSNKPMIEEIGAPPDAEALSEVLSKYHQRPIRVAGLTKRSSAHGGTYWINIDFSDQQETTGSPA